MRHRKSYRHFIAILMAASVALNLFSGCGKKKRTTQETNEVTLGIDVAKYQGTIDWEQVAQSGIDFAIVRVGYRGIENGEINEDTNAKYNLQQASRAGISLGVYFFSTAITEEEAKEEANWLAEQIAGYPITYPVAYDCEGFNESDSRQNSLSRKERTDIALAFLETIESHGYEGMFYGSKGDMEFNNAWDVSRIEDDYKIWVAQYPAEPYPKTPESSYSGVHHMWQYSTNGTVPGISQPVDLNIAYFGYDGIEEPMNPKAQEEAEADVEALMDFQSVDEQVTAKSETNLRSIPSQDTDSEVLRTLKNGEVAQRIAVSTSGWSKLVLDGKEFYAVSSYLTTDLDYEYQSDFIIPAQANEDDIETQFYEANQQVTAKDTVNLRSIPSVEREDAQIIAQLKNGEVATCVGTSDNGWSKLIYRGTTCYAVSSYLQPVDPETVVQREDNEIDTQFAPANDQVTAKDKVNLRKLPSVEDEDAEIITQLKKGDVATRIGISDNGWSKLIYNGTTCYAVTSYLIAVGADQESASAGNDEIETQFEEMNDRVTAKVEVNLRTLPSVEDPDCVVVAKLYNGDVVTRTGINRDVGWSRVVYNGQTVYCVSSYLTAAE